MIVDYRVVIGVFGVTMAVLAVMWVVWPEHSARARRVRRWVLGFVSRWKVYLVTLPFVVVFFVSVALLREQGLRVDEAIYEALRMFTLNANFEGVEYDKDEPIQIVWVLRLLAPALTATGILGFLYGKLSNRRMLLMRGHFVVVGLGGLGRAICEHLLLASSRGVLAIERNADNPNIDYLRSQGVRVIVGDATSPEVLEYARVKYAAKFIAVTGDDFVNLQAVIQAVDNPGQSSSTAKHKKAQARKVEGCFTESASSWALVHISDSNIRDSLSPESLDSTSATHLDLPKVLERDLYDFIRLFSSFQKVSQQLLARKNIDDWPDDESRLVVIAGFGKLGREMLEQVLKKKTRTPVWIVDSSLEGQTPIELVTDMRFDDVRRAEEDLPVLTYVQAAELLTERVRVFSCDVMNRKFGEELLERSRQEWVKEILLFLWTDNDLRNVSVSGRLKQYLQESGDVKVSIVSRRFGLAVEAEKEGGPVESGVDEFWFMDEFFRSFFAE